MHQSELVLEKYCLIQSGYFRLATIVALGMGITYGKLIYCRGVAEVNVDKKISTLDYNNRKFYDCFNNPFTYEFGIPDLHLPTITIDDIAHPHKISQCTPDLLPDSISVASGNSVRTLTTPSDSPHLLPYDDPNTLHVMKKGVTFQGRVHIGYYGRKHGQKYATKRQSSIAPHPLIRTRNFINVMGFPGLVQRQGLVS